MAERPMHQPEDFFAFAAYQELEARSEVRHELVGGRVIAMAGGTTCSGPGCRRTPDSCSLGV